MLPEFPEPSGASDPQRIREVAVQQMIEGTARAKTQRALRTSTRPSAEERGFNIGDLVEFYRPPSNKDTPGWHGPARVCDTTDATRGHVSIKWQGKVLACRLQDLRHELSHAHLCHGPGESL